MTAPRIELDVDKISYNARSLVERLGRRGIAVTGVTKAVLGSPAIAHALMSAGVQGLGDSRVENIETMMRSRVPSSMTLIRSPMPSQVDRVVRCADVTFNTEPDVIANLADAAKRAGLTHGIVLMVELGDLREGIMPAELEAVARVVCELPNLQLLGIGTNLACRSGVAPDTTNMAELSALANRLEGDLGRPLAIVSGGNSANLDWALSDAPTGRINDLRIGEAILLGCEPLHRRPIQGLRTDAVSIVAEVIEAQTKPTLPRGTIGQAAFGRPSHATDRGDIAQAILALGRQDADPLALRPPDGMRILDASSDHLVIDAGQHHLRVGDEVRFVPGYSALVRAMTSPFVTTVLLSANREPPTSCRER